MQSPSELVDWDRNDREGNLGRIVYDDYQRSKATFPGCIFTITVTYDLTLSAFCHRPYERYWDIGHEDLNPMLFDSAIRGRLEQNDEGKPELILKEPHSATAFFDLVEAPSALTN